MKPLIKTIWWAIRVVAQYLLMTVVVLAVFSLLYKVHFLAVAVAILVIVIVGIAALCLVGIFIRSCIVSLRQYYLVSKKAEALKDVNMEDGRQYKVTIKLDRKYHLAIDEGDGNEEIITTLTTVDDVFGYRYELTEQEIKSADENLWKFAVPVEGV